MSTETITTHVRMVKRIGRWTGIRYLRNQGVPFALAHLIVLGHRPRFG